MQAKGAIGEVRHAEVFRGGQEIQRLARQQRRHRDLKRLGHAHAPALIRAAGMNVHHIEPHADRIGEPARARAALVILDNVLLGDAGLRHDPPRLANVGILRDSVGRSHQVGAQFQLGIAVPAAVARRVALQPAEKGLRGLLGAL